MEGIAGKPDIIGHELTTLAADKAAIGEKLAALQAAEQASEAALKVLEAQLATAAEASGRSEYELLTGLGARYARVCR